MEINEFKNLTWHNIRVFRTSGKWIDIKPIDWVRIQLNQNNEKVWEVDGIAILKQTYSVSEAILNLYAPEIDWVGYIVSSIVANTTKRKDFFVVGQTIKSADKRTVLGCSWLCANPFI